MIATRCTSDAQADVEAETDADYQPDRLTNSEEYEPVLPNTEHTVAEPTESNEQEG